MKKKNQFWYGVASFVIPVLIMIFLYWRWKIYPGGPRTVVSGDGITQFINFFDSFHDVLTGKQSGLYSFHAGMGLNYYAFMSYYLGGFLTPIVFFFSKATMPIAYYVLTLLKIGLASLAFWIYAKETFKVKKSMNVALAVAYSLMSFVIAHSEVIIWLDVFMYFPLIILGVDRLLDKRKPKLLFFSYLALFLTNYYFGFMVGVFSFLYFVIRYCLDFKKYKARLIPYLLTSLLSGLASMVMVLPILMDLKQAGQPLTKINRLFVEGTGFWDLIVKNLIGTYDTTKYNTIPFIYIGLIPLVFAIFFFVTKKVTKGAKIGYGLLALLIISSFYIWPLALFWQGFHAPNMFHFRFSFIFSFLIIMLAGYAMPLLERDEVWKIKVIIISLMACFCLSVLLKTGNRYYWVISENMAATLLMLGLYFLYFQYVTYKQSNNKGIQWLVKNSAKIMICLMIGEAFINAHFVSNRMHRNDWPYLMTKTYNKDAKKMEKFVSIANKKDGKNFYHFESILGNGTVNNDGFRYNYSGIHMFSSMRNCNVSRVLNGLGFRNAQKDGLTVDYMNNTLLMDSLMGVRYNVVDSNPEKYGFKEISKAGDLQLYENENALPAGIIAKGNISKFKMDYNNPLIGQENLLKGLTGKDYPIYKEIEPKLVEVHNIVPPKENDKSISLPTNRSNLPRTLVYEVTIPAGEQAYFELLPKSDVYKDFEFSTWARVIGPKYDTNTKQILSLGSYYNLGTYHEEQKIRFEVRIDGRHDIEIKKPKILLLNLDTYNQVISELKTQGVNLQTNGRFATAKVNLSKDSNIFTTIPYDAGWTLTIDGKKEPIKSVNGGFIQIHVPKGKHNIKLSYFPPGLELGLILFVGSSILFVLFDIWYEYRRKN